jgi:hypothetical protein
MQTVNVTASFRVFLGKSPFFRGFKYNPVRLRPKTTRLAPHEAGGRNFLMILLQSSLEGRPLSCFARHCRCAFGFSTLGERMKRVLHFLLRVNGGSSDQAGEVLRIIALNGKNPPAHSRQPVQLKKQNTVGCGRAAVNSPWQSNNEKSKTRTLWVSSLNSQCCRV